MSTVALARPFLQGKARVSLREQLVSRGMPILDDECHAHKQAVLSQYRQGAFRYLWPAAWVVNHSPRAQEVFSVLSICVLIMAIFAGFGVIGTLYQAAFGNGSWLAVGQCMLSAIGLGVVFLVALFFRTTEAMQAGSAHWLREPITNLDGVDPRLHSRIRAALDIECAVVERHSFKVDPLYSVRVPCFFGLWHEEHYIGAHDTNTALDNL